MGAEVRCPEQPPIRRGERANFARHELRVGNQALRSLLPKGVRRFRPDLECRQRIRFSKHSIEHLADARTNERGGVSPCFRIVHQFSARSLRNEIGRLFLGVLRFPLFLKSHDRLFLRFLVAWTLLAHDVAPRIHPKSRVQSQYRPMNPPRSIAKTIYLRGSPGALRARKKTPAGLSVLR